MKKDRIPIFILVNDIHIDKQRSELVKGIFKQIFRISVEIGVSDIAIGGDVFTDRSGQPLDCLLTFPDIVDMADKFDKTIHVIPGNHDKTDPNDYRSYIDVYKDSRLLKIHREGCTLVIGGCIISFVPYFGDAKWMEEFSKARQQRNYLSKHPNIDHSKPSFLITHVAINGVRNNDGSEVVCDLKSSMFDDYTKVFVGHYHNASQIGKNIYYTGSAYQKDFGENITDKGCTIVYNDGSHEFVPLKFPKHIKHVIDIDDTETLRNLLEKYDGEDYDIIKFVFRGKKVDVNKINQSDIAARGIQCEFESIEEKEAIDNAVDSDALNYDKRSITKDFLKFCSENSIRGERMKFGLNLIKSL